MTARERESLLRLSGELLDQAVLSRNAAAVLTEHTLIPMAEDLAAALRSWAARQEDWSAELSELILGTTMQR